jgi:pyruvate-formate lyase-activating enzyme
MRKHFSWSPWLVLCGFLLSGAEVLAQTKPATDLVEAAKKDGVLVRFPA